MAHNISLSLPVGRPVRLLRAVAVAKPRLFADDIQLQATPTIGGSRHADVSGAFTVYALRANSTTDRASPGERIAGWSVTR